MRSRGAEHHAAAGRPGEFGVVDAISLAVNDGLLEAERVDEEPDEGAAVARAEGGPHLRWRCRCHAPIIPPVRRAWVGWIGTPRPATGEEGGPPGDGTPGAGAPGRSSPTPPPGPRGPRPGRPPRPRAPG